MAHERPDTDQLLQLAASGDQAAAERLLDLHRERLKGMVQMRMDQRLRARFDPSDVVQEALIRASERLPWYCRERPMPFYPWLRNIAWEQLVKHHERHLAEKRTFEREQLQRFLGHTHEVTGACFSPDGRWLVSMYGDGTIRLWDPRTGTLLVSWFGHSRAPFGWSYASCFTPDGKTLITGGADNTVRIWDLTEVITERL